MGTYQFQYNIWMKFMRGLIEMGMIFFYKNSTRENIDKRYNISIIKTTT